MTPQGRGSIGWRDSVCPATWLMPDRWHGGWHASHRATGWASATSQETHGEDGNLPKGPRG
eukprot:scaffold35428_cov48-Phaeocystis_antarctica.AAC.1